MSQKVELLPSLSSSKSQKHKLWCSYISGDGGVTGRCWGTAATDCWHERSLLESEFSMEKGAALFSVSAGGFMVWESCMVSSSEEGREAGSC